MGEALVAVVGRPDDPEVVVLAEPIEPRSEARPDPTGFASHLSLHQSAVDQLVALAIGHGQQVFGRVMGLGREGRAHELCPVIDRRYPSIGSIVSTCFGLANRGRRPMTRSLTVAILPSRQHSSRATPHRSTVSRRPRLLGWQFRQGRRVADAGQVAVLLRVHQMRWNLSRSAAEPPSRCLFRAGQVGTEPVEGLLSQPGLFRIVELRGVLPLACGGQRRLTSGVIAVKGSEIVGQLGVGGEGVGVQTG